VALSCAGATPVYDLTVKGEHEFFANGILVHNSTAGGGNWTAGVRLSHAKDGLYYVEHVERGQWDTATRNRVIRQTAETDGVGCLVSGEQEPGSGGKDQARTFVQLLAGFNVRVAPASGDKATRADPLSAQVNAGNVRLVRGAWNRAFVEELRSFPLGRHDDQVDAAATAFNRLVWRPRAGTGGGR
jgi:predicted phage terminase large subunit-like protein